jgi:hypothetical protein
VVRLLTVALAGLLLASCGSTRVSTVWTDVPEVATYVETFNASQRDWQVLVEYKDDAVASLLASDAKPDLVVARAPLSSTARAALVPLDFLFGGSLSRASFYRGSLDAGLDGNNTKALPVSFDLPVLIFDKTLQPDLAGFSLNLGTVRDLNNQFTAVPSKLPRRLAFSPRWGGFGLTLLHLDGVRFHEGFQGGLTWDSDSLARGLAELQGWPSPGWDQTADFRRKYLQSDPGPSLSAGRVQFFPTTLATFIAKPWDERRDLDFRFVDNGRVAALQTAVWAGIPAGAAARGAAEHFLAWFFRTDIQEKLVLQDKRQGAGFGLADGVPALVGDSLAKAYPELSGRLPRSDQVLFWGSLPADWASIEATVVRPWLATQTATENTLKTAMGKRQEQPGRN